VLSIGRIGAGDGFRYLINQVATQDARVKGQRLLSYYEATGYPPGMWWGAGAEAMGLSGKVTEEHMGKLFGEGCHPLTGAQLGRAFAIYRTTGERIAERLGALGHPASPNERARIEDEEHAKGTRQSVAGFDLTFSPPKSASVLWALGSDDVRDQVAAAHEAAWQRAMSDFQAEVAATRLGRNGVAQVDVKGITAAAFRHFYSRSGDPQLHTHVAVSALAETLDGRWRRLDSRAMYRAAAMVGERYTGHLTAELSSRLGLSWRYREGRTPGVRLPEVEGIGDELVRAFSTRRADIEADLAERVARYRADHGRSPDRRALAALAQEVTLAGRPDPCQRSFSEQQVEWRALAAEVTGVAPEHQAQALLAVCGPARQVSELGDGELASLVPEVLARVLETEGTWTTRDLQRRAGVVLREAGARSDAGAVDKLVEVVCADPDVYTVEAPEVVPVPGALRRVDGRSVFQRAGEERWTHRAVLDAEDALRRAVSEPGPAVEVKDDHLEGLGQDQRRAVMRLATSGRLVDALIGPAGTGKTTATAALVGVWRDAGRGVHLLAPSAVAADELGRRLGVPGETLDKALWHWRNGEDLPSRGDLVLIDEASMATSLKLAETVAFARRAGAGVRLVGDPAQLSAVGPGGGLELVAEAAGVPELTELRRFHNRWEAAASLGLRRGDPSVLGDYEAHGRIRSGLGPDVADQIYAAWRGAVDAGKEAVMVASDNETVAALAARARADRVATGEVEPGGVQLHDDSVAGVGDVVVTRRNDRRLALFAGGTGSGFVRNRDRWRVTGRHDGGALDVTHLRTGAAITLPPDYVADHMELSYAHTAHGAQGLTVDVGLAVVRTTDERRGLYVAMTRGREENVAFVVTEDLEEEPHGFHPDRSAREVLAQVLANHEPEGAGARIARSYERAERLDTLADRYEHARTADLERRMAQAAGEIGVPQLVGTAAWSGVLARADRADAAGLDPAAILIRSGATTAEAMVSRLARALYGDKHRVVPRLVAGLVPAAGPATTPEIADYLAGLGRAMESRIDALAAVLGADPPTWAASLGDAPDDPAVRAEWAHELATVAAWRERHGITGSQPLGGAAGTDHEPDPARLVVGAALERIIELAEVSLEEVADLRPSQSLRSDAKPRMRP
jgi:conjugative relaxase-like TrwC/TraI family protein